MSQFDFMHKPHDPSTTTAQDADVTRHLMDNQTNKISFDKSNILAYLNHWHKVLKKET